MYWVVIIWNRDLKSKLVKSEEECSRLQQELLSGRRRSASMESDLHNKEKALNHLRTKLAVVEQVSVTFLIKDFIFSLTFFLRRN